MKTIKEIEKAIEPWVAKPSRKREEEIYQIKKTTVAEVWAKQRPILRTQITQLLEEIVPEESKSKIDGFKNSFDNGFNQCRQEILNKIKEINQ